MDGPVQVLEDRKAVRARRDLRNLPPDQHEALLREKRLPPSGHERSNEHRQVAPAPKEELEVRRAVTRGDEVCRDAVDGLVRVRVAGRVIEDGADRRQSRLEMSVRDSEAATFKTRKRRSPDAAAFVRSFRPLRPPSASSLSDANAGPAIRRQ
jgi:hypothetical protein